LKRIGKRVKKLYNVPEELYEFKPKLKQSLPKEPLNWMEILKLYGLPRDPSLNMFLFECFTGIRYSDITEDLKINDTYIMLLQKKTGKIAAPALNPLAKVILERNSVKNSDVGNFLKKLNIHA